MAFCLSGYFIYLGKTKNLKIREYIKIKKGTFKISFPSDESVTGGIIGEDVIIGKYKVSDIVNNINDFIKDFNKTNKKVNYASSIITFLSGIAFLLSALLIE